MVKFKKKLKFCYQLDIESSGGIKSLIGNLAIILQLSIVPAIASRGQGEIDEVKKEMSKGA